ncbi:MAG TPA: hypothetical protein VFG46_02975 [Chryseolinea sp.]|nr:hypothetical protein [Chryseolinea sp.]
MKRSIVIGIVVILMLFLASRILLNTGNEIDHEMQSYVNNLNYDFTAKVDSIILVNSKKGTGFLVCKITSGICNRFVEDSLNHHLINYKRIRFLNFKPNDQFQVFLGGISKYQPNDSITVNSKEDKFNIFRREEVLLKSEVSHSTTQKVYFAFWLRD